MARILCQALERGGRITLIWSEGPSWFEPYHLTGAERDHLLGLARHARQRLAEALAGDAAQAGAALAAVGNQLYGALFRTGAADRAGAAEVEAWLAAQLSADTDDTLEIVSDMAEPLPWALVYGQPVPAGALGPDSPAWAHFWGRRFALSSGSRINPLRATPLLQEPTLLLALDPELPAASSDALAQAGSPILSAAGLSARLGQEAPDVLVVVANVGDNALRLGPDRVTVEDLRRWIDAAPAGNPEPVVVLLGVGGLDAVDAWQAIVSRASASLGGLVAAQVPLPQAAAFQLGRGFLARFLSDRQPVGSALRTLRQEQGLAALALDASCPAAVRVLGDDDDAPADSTRPATPLPDNPYRAFAAYEIEDRPLFLGRADDTVRCARVLDDHGACGVFLTGAVGAGKTSLLQAGLVPYLEEDAIGYRWLRERKPLAQASAESDYPVRLLRASGDLAGQLAVALCDFCAQPFAYITPSGRTVTVDLPSLLQDAIGAPSTAIQDATRPAAGMPPPLPDEERGPLPRALWTALEDDASLLGRFLDEVVQRLPFELVIGIDQGEDLITEVHEPVEVARRLRALEMLQRLHEAPARCKFVLAVRTEYLPRLLPSCRDGWRQFHLEEMSEERLAEALAGPASEETEIYSGEVPAVKYAFRMESGVAEDIAARSIEAGRRHQTSPLSWAQAVCTLLYERGRRQGDKALRPADLKKHSAVKDPLVRLLQARLQSTGLFGRDRTALVDLIAAMTTRHPSGGPTLDLVEARTELRHRWKGGGAVEPVVNKAAAADLLTIDQLSRDGAVKPHVSVAHESIGEAVLLLQEERRRSAYGRARVVDTLWIMVPLLFLVGAATFYYMRQNAGLPPEQAAAAAREFAQQIGTAQLPQYRGLLAQAEQALRAGNVLAARQALLTLPARASVVPAAVQEFPFVQMQPRDLRGFDWRYLWRQVNNQRQRFEGHPMRVESVAVSPDGRLAATASLDGAVKLWNLKRGLIVASLKAPPPVHAVAFAADGRALAAAADRAVHLWDIGDIGEEYVTALTERKPLAGHQGPVQALASSGDGTLASAGSDKTILLWDIAKGEQKAALKGEHDDPILAVAFSPDGKTLASGGDKGSVVLWDVAGAKKKSAMKTAYQSVAALAFDAEGKTLCTGGRESQYGVDQGMVRFWDAATGKEQGDALSHSMAVFGVAYQPDGKALVSVGRDMHARRWDLASRRETARWDGSLGWLRAVAVSPDGVTLLAGGDDRTVHVWSTDQPSGPQIVDAHRDWAVALALGDKDTLLASGSRDGSVRLWDAATGRPLGDLPAQKGAITALAFITPEEKEPLLAVAAWGPQNAGTLKLWSLQRSRDEVKAKELQALTGHDDGITALTAGPDRRLASGDASGKIVLWDIATGKPAHVLPIDQGNLEGHRGPIRGLAFAQRGGLLLSAGHDRLVRFWDTATGKIGANRKILPAHSSPIETLAAMDGIDAEKQPRTFFLTGGQDQSVKLWRLPLPGEETRPELMQSAQVHNQPVAAVLLLPDLIASGSWDETIRLWDQDGNERLALLGSGTPVRALAAAQDLSVLISAGNDGKLRFWRAASIDVTPRKTADDDLN